MSCHMSHSQNGVALVVALVLLLVITLLGLGAIRSTSLQQKLTGNFYDREIAFQSAEAGLQSASVAMQNIGADPSIAVNCDVANGGQNCFTNPFNDPDVSNTTYAQTVQKGGGKGQYTPTGNADWQPQYIIECMGAAQAPAPSNFHNALTQNYGGGAAEPDTPAAAKPLTYYRITARSGDPTQTEVKVRAVVTLQAYYRSDQACVDAGAGAGTGEP
ncbi:MAG: PilX N-terminal domain-containing pilus assembly protein [Sinobacteraceae bacterium]|nr:PilX N-terminal domain-containing pilus assembly protein [Nevskiaceae bacterium]